MAMTDRVSVTLTGHGRVSVTTGAMDRTIARYLPASPFGLRQKIDTHEKNGYKPGHYDDLLTVTEYLMVLAELDGPVDY